MTTKTNNKRILKNTLVLYVRMACTMGIGFISTRELLSALGVVDFGLVNVIGSVVTMFSFISGAMQAAVSRFFSYDLGRKDTKSLQQTFNITLIIFTSISVIILILIETIGYWFFEYNLNIPQNRKLYATYFFHFTALSFTISIISIPYSSLVIAHENMKLYATITTIESIFRLAIIYILYIGDYDRFSFYGALLTTVSALILAIYLFMCTIKYPESHIKYYWDKKRSLEILAFGGWNLWGALSGLFTNTLLNILLNNYFGPIVNAARAIAMQGATGVSSFVNNFLTATRPQIFKYYAEHSYNSAIELTLNSSRIGYFLLLIFATPVILEMPYILELWLNEVPQYTITFMRIILITRLIEILSHPLVTLSHATGRVASYQTTVAILQWLTLPLSWAALKMGGSPTSVFLIQTGIALISLLAQIYLIKRSITQFSINTFISQTIIPIIITTAISSITPTIAFAILDTSTTRFIYICAISFLSCLISIYIFGIKSHERAALIVYIKNKLNQT